MRGRLGDRSDRNCSILHFAYLPFERGSAIKALLDPRRKMYSCVTVSNDVDKLGQASSLLVAHISSTAQTFPPHFLFFFKVWNYGAAGYLHKAIQNQKPTLLLKKVK